MRARRSKEQTSRDSTRTARTRESSPGLAATETSRPNNPKRTTLSAGTEHCSQDTPLEREALVICAADKLHNLRSLLIDLREHGPDVFLKFVKDEPSLRGKGEATLWYYETLLSIFERRGVSTARLLRPAVDALREIVRELP